MSIRKKHFVSLVGLTLVAVAACGNPTELSYTEVNNQTLENLEESCRIQELKEEIFAIGSANTTNEVNLKRVRAELDPLVDELAIYFKDNRPKNEEELTQGAWQNVWLDDADIGRGPDFINLEFDQIYQIVEDGYYYNVSNNTIEFSLFGGKVRFPINSYLRGNYVLTNRADETTSHLSRRNVIDLEFADNKFRFGLIPENRPLADIVDDIDSNRILSLPIPGPAGVTGELWNLYVDDDIRISVGTQDGDEDVTDLYILRRTEFAGPLEALPAFPDCL